MDWLLYVYWRVRIWLVGLFASEERWTKETDRLCRIARERGW